jgi:hypothetical protein
MLSDGIDVKALEGLVHARARMRGAHEPFGCTGCYAGLRGSGLSRRDAGGRRHRGQSKTETSSGKVDSEARAGLRPDWARFQPQAGAGL